MAEIDALRTFLAIHEQGSFSRAARVLHLTQPAVSARVRQLEQQLRAPVFERTVGGIRLTSVGSALLPYAERAMATVRDAEAAVREVRDGTAGPVSIVLVGTLAGPPFTAALRRFRREHPRVDVAIRTARSRDVARLVLRGEATLGIRYHQESIAGLEWTVIGAESLVVVCAADHPLAGRRVNTLAALRAERWIAFPESAGQPETAGAHVFGLFLSHGLGEIDWTPVDSLTAQKRLVEGGFGLALMPVANIREELDRGDIGVITVSGLRPRMPVFVVIREGGFLSAAARRLFEILNSEFSRALDSRGRSTGPRGKRRAKRRD